MRNHIIRAMNSLTVTIVVLSALILAERWDSQPQDFTAEREQLQSQRAAQVKADLRETVERLGDCQKDAKLSDRIVVSGTSMFEGYFADTIYVLTFDEAYRAAKSGKVWIHYYC